METGGRGTQLASDSATENKDHSEDNTVSRRNVQPITASTSKFQTDATPSSRPQDLPSLADRQLEPKPREASNPAPGPDTLDEDDPKALAGGEDATEEENDVLHDRHPLDGRAADGEVPGRSASSPTSDSAASDRAATPMPPQQMVAVMTNKGTKHLKLSSNAGYHAACAQETTMHIVMMGARPLTDENKANGELVLHSFGGALEMGGRGKNPSCLAFLPDDDRSVDEKAQALFAGHPLCTRPDPPKYNGRNCAVSAKDDMRASWHSDHAVCVIPLMEDEHVDHDEYYRLMRERKKAKLAPFDTVVLHMITLRYHLNVLGTDIDRNHNRLAVLNELHRVFHIETEYHNDNFGAKAPITDAVLRHLETAHANAFKEDRRFFRGLDEAGGDEEAAITLLPSRREKTGGVRKHSFPEFLKEAKREEPEVTPGRWPLMTEDHHSELVRFIDAAKLHRAAEAEAAKRTGLPMYPNGKDLPITVNMGTLTACGVWTAQYTSRSTYNVDIRAPRFITDAINLNWRHLSQDIKVQVRKYGDKIIRDSNSAHMFRMLYNELVGTCAYHDDHEWLGVDHNRPARPTLPPWPTPTLQQPETASDARGGGGERPTDPNERSLDLECPTGAIRASTGTAAAVGRSPQQHGSRGDSAATRRTDGNERRLVDVCTTIERLPTISHVDLSRRA